MTPDISYHGPVVGFDLDDTLFRERDFCRSGFRFLCDPDRYRVLDLNPYPGKELLGKLCRLMEEELSAGRNPFVPFEDFFLPIALEAHLKWELGPHIEAYRAHHPEALSPAPGMPELMEELARRGIRMALITDGRSATQRRKIEALGLQRFFSPDMILISEETGYDKLNSKEMFASVVRKYPEAARFFYIGNNALKDFYHPNLMGWTTVQVPHHPDDVHPDHLPPTPLHAPMHKIASPEDFLNLI